MISSTTSTAATMTARPLAVPGAFEFTPTVFPDDRGIFLSPYQEPAFLAVVGHRLFPVAQTNHSRSRLGVTRGVHFTVTPPGCAKYVYCPQGACLDIVVDIRVGSPAYGCWDTVRLDAADFRAVYLPVGVGHAFVGLRDETVVSYLISQSYVPENELALSVRDPALALPLPGDLDPIMSERDRVAPTLAQAAKLGILPRYEECLAIEEHLYAASAARTAATDGEGS